MNLRTPLFWLFCLLPVMGAPALAASISPASLTLTPGQVATVTVSGIKGTLSIQNAKPNVATATLTSPQITVAALKAGRTAVTVKDKRGKKTLQVTVTAPPMTVAPEALSLVVGQSDAVTVANPNGTVRVTSSHAGIATATLNNNVVTVQGKMVGSATVTIKDSKTTKQIAVKVTSNGGGGVTSTEGRLLASNCFQCHGTNGSGGFDKLIGESESEIYNELTEFSSGQEDADGIMAAHTKGYTDAQFRAIAKFLSSVANP